MDDPQLLQLKQELLEPVYRRVLPLRHCLTVTRYSWIPSREAAMFDTREVSIVKRQGQLHNRLKRVRLQLGWIHGVDLWR